MSLYAEMDWMDVFMKTEGISLYTQKKTNLLCPHSCLSMILYLIVISALCIFVCFARLYCFHVSQYHDLKAEFKVSYLLFSFESVYSQS